MLLYVDDMLWMLVSMSGGSRQKQCMLRCCSLVLMRTSGNKTGPSYSVLLVNQVVSNTATVNLHKLFCCMVDESSH